MSPAIISVAAFSFAALVVALLVFVVETPEFRWAIAAASLGLAALGFALNSFILALRTEKKLDKIIERLREVQERETSISSLPEVLAAIWRIIEYLISRTSKWGK